MCSSIEPLEQIQCSNLAYQTEGSVRQHFWTELNECVYQLNHWQEQILCSNLVFKTQIKPVCHRIKQVCSSIKLTHSLSLWLSLSYRTESSTEQQYIAKLLIFNKYSGKLMDSTPWIIVFSSQIKAVPCGQCVITVINHGVFMVRNIYNRNCFSLYQSSPLSAHLGYISSKLWTERHGKLCELSFYSSYK